MLDNLRHSMDELNAIRWRHQRTARTTKSQAEAVVAYLEKLRTHPGALSEADVATMIDWWRASGLAVGTIQRRLTVLRTMLKHMGLPMPAVHLKPERKLKWWLRPEEQRRVIAYCGPPSEVGTGLFARYVGFVCHSGVRVEEALRIERRDFEYMPPAPPPVGVELDADEREPGRYLLTVRGTKTNSAARVILLSDKAVEFIGLGWLMDGARGGSEHVFGTYTYTRLADEWDHVRSAMGFPPDATLKALRRTFARYATEKGMPAPVLMQYLGHTQIETTMGYLRLVGAYDPKVVAQWL